MPKAKLKVKLKLQIPKKDGMNWGSAAFALIFVLSAIFVYYPVGDLGALLLGILGALVAIRNIQRAEELGFLVAVIALMIVSSTIQNLYTGLLSSFLVNLTLAFGVAGLIVALGLLVKLGWEK